MSTDEKEKSCKGCIHINCRCSDRQQKNYECYNDGLTPEQQYAQELLEALKYLVNDIERTKRLTGKGMYLTELAKYKQLIAKAEGREL